MSISPRLAKALGLVRDYDGTRPCIPPQALAKIAAMASLYDRVAKDESENINPTHNSNE